MYDFLLDLLRYSCIFWIDLFPPFLTQEFTTMMPNTSHFLAFDIIIYLFIRNSFWSGLLDSFKANLPSEFWLKIEYFSTLKKFLWRRILVRRKEFSFPTNTKLTFLSSLSFVPSEVTNDQQMLLSCQTIESLPVLDIITSWTLELHEFLLKKASKDSLASLYSTSKTTSVN